MQKNHLSSAKREESIGFHFKKKNLSAAVAAAAADVFQRTLFLGKRYKRFSPCLVIVVLAGWFIVTTVSVPTALRVTIHVSVFRFVFVSSFFAHCMCVLTQFDLTTCAHSFIGENPRSMELKCIYFCWFRLPIDVRWWRRRGGRGQEAVDIITLICYIGTLHTQHWNKT